jgi:FkbM family methyltransferase
MTKELNDQDREKQLKAYDKYNGPGIRNKMLMWIFAPDYYTPHPIIKFLAWFKKKNPHPTSPTETEEPSVEKKLIRFFLKNLKASDVFYDMGANYGIYTALAIPLCREVHSFEPLPHVFSALKAKFTQPNVFLNNVALSDKVGEVIIHVNKFDAGSSTTIESRTAIDKNAYTEAVTVRAQTLGEYVKSHLPPTVIKMDVEGAESPVIDGGADFFKNNSPIVGMEVWGGKYNEISMKAVRKLMDLGYEIWKINFDGELERTDYARLASLGVTDNFIFKRP